MKKKIVFISEINAQSINTTSTHILTENILYGLKKAGYYVTFLAICSTEDAFCNTEQHYRKLVDELYLVRSQFGESNNKYKKLFDMVKGVFISRPYKKILSKKLDLDENTVLVSHTPSYEAFFLCRELLKRCNSIKYIQYWSDPIALSGIMPEQFNYKRQPFYWLEKYAYKLASEIVFGTEPLYMMNSALYPNYKSKMRYVDLAYLHNNDSEIDKNHNLFIYAGNYYKAIRNIKPLYEAFSELTPNCRLDIYGSGDVELNPTKNIRIHSRISPDELAKIENSYQNTIVLLNHGCMQIPGKTFYRMNTNQNILVIADGSHREELKTYLSRYNRFLICNNDKDDIKVAVQKLMKSEPFHCSDEFLRLLSPEYISSKIIEGDML